MDQKKIYTQQLVAEVLTQMRNTEVNSLPVYDKGHFIGKITYEEIMSFLDAEEKAESIYAHKLNFDIGTAFYAIKRADVEVRDKNVKQNSLSKQFVIGFSAVAVVALILIAITLTVFKQDPSNSAIKNTLANNDADKVILTLANGENVTLNEAKTGVVIADSKLNYNDGSPIDANVHNTVSNQSMVLSVPRKGMYQILLPDGSKVWLNSASTLKFPATFEGATKRRVELNGEGYFEIAKVMLKSQVLGDKERRMPFIVVTDKQEIEVLGTHFNVNAYRDEEHVKTTLIEGSVRLKPIVKRDQLLEANDPSSLDPMDVEGGKSIYANAVVLKPNQQATLSGANITVKNVDADEAYAWKDGEYIFRNTALEDIMRMLTRWYDIEVVYQNKNAASTLLGGAISKSAKINDVLKMLELTANVHFKIEGKRITVIE